MDYGKLIKKERMAQGMSFRTLSNKSGVSTTTIYHYENGVLPTIYKLDMILKALGVSLTIGEEETA